MRQALWESLLDSSAHVLGSKATRALRALQQVHLDTPEPHRAYFQHFRYLLALERVGANQAMLSENASEALRMRRGVKS